jgi:hypothetical protein
LLSFKEHAGLPVVSQQTINLEQSFTAHFLDCVDQDVDMGELFYVAECDFHAVLSLLALGLLM